MSALLNFLKRRFLKRDVATAEDAKSPSQSLTSSESLALSAANHSAIGTKAMANGAVCAADRSGCSGGGCRDAIARDGTGHDAIARDGTGRDDVARDGYCRASGGHLGRVDRCAQRAEDRYRDELRKVEVLSDSRREYSSLGMGLIGSPSSQFTVPRGQPISIFPLEGLATEPMNFGSLQQYRGFPLAPREQASQHMLDITAKQYRGMSIDEVLNEQH